MEEEEEAADLLLVEDVVVVVVVLVVGVEGDVDGRKRGKLLRNLSINIRTTRTF